MQSAVVQAMIGMDAFYLYKVFAKTSIDGAIYQNVQISQVMSVLQFSNSCSHGNV